MQHLPGACSQPIHVCGRCFELSCALEMDCDQESMTEVLCWRAQEWRLRDFRTLLVGIVRHGAGQWGDIMDDAELGLAPRVMHEICLQNNPCQSMAPIPATSAKPAHPVPDQAHAVSAAGKFQAIACLGHLE